MDLQTMLICVAFTLVSAIMIYLIYACGMQERTYDEVIAEQRRLHQSELLITKKMDKKEKVKKKKKTKAEKGTTSADSDKAEDTVEEEVEATAEVLPELVPVSTEPAVATPTKGLRKRKDKHVVREDKHQTSVMTVEEKVITREVRQETEARPGRQHAEVHKEKISEVKTSSSKRKEERDGKSPSLEAERAVEALIQNEAKVNQKNERDSKKSKKNKSSGEQGAGANKQTATKVEPVMNGAPAANATKSTSGKSDNKVPVHKDLAKSTTAVHKDSAKSSTAVHKDSAKSTTAVLKESGKSAMPVNKESSKVVKSEARQSQAARKEAGKVGSAPSVAAQKAAGSDTGKTSTPQLMQTLRSATLNDSEIQSMIEVLLNKQGGVAPSVEWTKKSQKGDPLALMKKQLEEKERALVEEQQFSITANNKLRELKQELIGERQRYAALEKSSQDQVNNQAAEIKALVARMQSSHGHHTNEVKALRQQMDSMKGGMGDATQNTHLHQLTEENRKLKEAAAKAGDVAGMNQQMKILQEQLNIAMTRAATSENEKKTMEKRYEDQIRKVESSKRDSESVLSRKLSEVTEELHRAEARNANMTRDFEKSSNASLQLQQDITNMRNRDTTQQDKIHVLEKRLKDAEKSNSDYQDSVHSMEQKLMNIQQQNTEKDKKLNEMSKENSMLAAELRTTKERTAGEGQEAPSNEPSGAVHADHKEGGQNGTTDAMLQSLSKLQAELESKELEIKKLAQDLDTQKNKNNNAHQADSNKQLQEMKHLKDELSAVKKENHELRVGCETATKALTKAEKSAEEIAQVQAELKAKVQEVTSLQDALDTKQAELDNLQKSSSAPVKSGAPSGELLKRLFPEAKIKSNMTEEEWASTFESEAKKYIERTSQSDSNNTESELTASQQAQAKLQAQVQHYKAVLADTEGILNKLQSSVESEEKKWQQRTIDEVNRLKEEFSKKNNSELEEKIRLLEEKLSLTENERESLKSQLSQSSQSLHSLHSEANSQQSLAEEELAALKEQLGEERKSKKELSSANVRLNSLVKIGQDALKAEQDVVRKLQLQLASKQQSMANGTSPSSPQMKELREKLDKAQRQLEREAHNNRQLAKRVAIMAASAANNGTSV